MHNRGWITLYEAIYILNDLFHQRKSSQVFSFHSTYTCQVYTNTREQRFALLYLYLLYSFGYWSVFEILTLVAF